MSMGRKYSAYDDLSPSEKKAFKEKSDRLDEDYKKRAEVRKEKAAPFFDPTERKDGK